MSDPEQSGLHTTFLQSLHFFFAAACSLDKEEESKPLCLLKSNLTL